MSRAEFDDVQAHLLSPEERLDVGETDIDLDEGMPRERPWEVSQWGLTAREARLKNLSRRLARELSDVTDQGAALPGFDSGVWDR